MPKTRKDSKRNLQLQYARSRRQIKRAREKQAAILAIDGGMQIEESGGNGENLESGLALENKALLQEAVMPTNSSMLQLKELIQQCMLRRYLGDDDVCLSEAVSDFVIEIEKPESDSPGPHDYVDNEKHSDGRHETGSGHFVETTDNGNGTCLLNADSDCKIEEIIKEEPASHQVKRSPPSHSDDEYEAGISCPEEACEKNCGTEDHEDFILKATVKSEPIILQNNWEGTKPCDGGNEASISYYEEPSGNDSLTKHSQGNGKKPEYGLLSLSQKEAAMQKEATMQTEVSMLQIDKQTKKNIPRSNEPQVARSRKRTLHETKGNRYQRDMSSSVAQSSEISKILSRPVTILPKPLPQKAFVNDPLRVGLMSSGITSTGQNYSPPTYSVVINDPTKLAGDQNSSNPLLVQNLAVVNLPNLLVAPIVAQSYVSQPTQTTFPVTSSSANSQSMPSKGLLVTGTSSVSQTLKPSELYNKESQNHIKYSVLHQNKKDIPNVTSSLSSSILLQTLAGEACASSSRRSNCSSVGEFQSQTQSSPFSVSTLSHTDSSSSQSYFHPKLTSSDTTNEIDNLCNSSFARCETTCSEDSYHFSSEDESDVLEDNDLNKSLQELDHDKLKALIVRQRNNRTMFLIKNAHKFSVKKDDLYCCEICQVYYTNGLFRMSKHLQKHDLNS